MKRRNFTKITAFGSLIGLAPTEIFSKSLNSDKDIKISLAQWSLNKAIKSGKLSPLDFAKKAKSLELMQLNMFLACILITLILLKKCQ